ncbi:TRAP transporter substrate-binding protein [Chakrabartyella piscis]|uniref:TRAP transporter substrate-binding protein n=1 Tax=Chakrabartyella piscis TaxID=2918914 RepID=UPI002958387A|nr:TRAP transporter substrate-binding protein [Chakrabartyella piscis]
MKKFLAMILVTSMMVSLAACSSGSGSSSESASSSTDAETTISDETYELRFAIVSSATHTHNKSIVEWAEGVYEDTNGRLSITLLDSGQLGGERDYVESLQLGSLDMMQVSASVVGNFLPDYNIMSLPYLFETYDDIENITSGPIGENLFEQLEGIGIVGLTWFSNGFRSVYSNTPDVTTPAELNGVKIRVMESTVMINSLNAMGASAVPMSYSEVYTSIQQGVLDGAENALGNILSDKFYEVCKELTLTEHFATPGVVAISQKSFNALPADLQEYLIEASKELGEIEMEMDKVDQAAALDELVAFGMNVTEVDKESFVTAGQSIYASSCADVSDEVKGLLTSELGIEF